MRFSLCGFLIIKLQTALHHAVRCGALLLVVLLCHFASGFSAVYAVW